MERVGEIMTRTLTPIDPNADYESEQTRAEWEYTCQQNAKRLERQVNEQNYNSHSWHWVRDPGSPYQSPEHTRVCKDCGLEDMGHPDEFDIEYPNCADGRAE